MRGNIAYAVLHLANQTTESTLYTVIIMDAKVSGEILMIKYSMFNVHANTYIYVQTPPPKKKKHNV